MQANAKIDQVADGIHAFQSEVGKDRIARRRVDVAIVTFDSSVRVVQEFCAIDSFHAPTLCAAGNTCMGEAILRGIELLETRKSHYKSEGIEYTRPWIFLLTDGEPTDIASGDHGWNTVVQAVHCGEDAKKFLFFAVGVDPANMHALAQIAHPRRPPVRLRGLAFRELFAWMSASVCLVACSRPGDQVALPPVNGWGQVES